MKYSEVQQYIGKTGEIGIEGLTINVKIKDVKNSYGQTRFLICPVDGTGEKWVDSTRVKITEKPVADTQPAMALAENQ